MFATIIPWWQEGDTFLAAVELQRFRILAVDATMHPDEAKVIFHAVCVTSSLVVTGAMPPWR